MSIVNNDSPGPAQPDSAVCVCVSRGAPGVAVVAPLHPRNSQIDEMKCETRDENHFARAAPAVSV